MSAEPVNVSGYPLADDLRETMASALGLDVDEGWLSIALTLMEQTTMGSTKPRTWSLPPEPGPEVTAVRDSDGDVWKREGDLWVVWHGDERWYERTWDRLASFYPLTDASAEGVS